MSDRHTILVPTFNRPALVQGLARYYATRAPALSLLVLDSSGAEVQEANAAVLASLGARVRHLTFPEDVLPHLKIQNGLEAVATPYASFCADDDIVFPEALQQSIAFLEKRADHVCAHGVYLNFRASGRELHIRRDYFGPDNDAAHPGARIFRLLQDYESLFYAVYRIADLREIFAALPVPANSFQELFQSVATVIKGKVKRLPAIYAARRTGPPADSGRANWHTFNWFAASPGEVLQGYAAYREKVWSFYGRGTSEPRLGREAFLRALDVAHAVYFAAGCSPLELHSALQEYWPGDAYMDTASRRTMLLRLAEALSYAPAAVCAIPWIWVLDRRAQAAGGTPWKCRLWFKSRGLALLPDFRDRYLDVCSMADSPAP